MCDMFEEEEKLKAKRPQCIYVGDAIGHEIKAVNHLMHRKMLESAANIGVDKVTIMHGWIIAMIDGANLIQQIMTVEWPAIKDMVVIQFILQAGNIMSIGFEKAYALQTDLNLNTAEIIATYVYKKGLLDGDYSFSTAVGLFNTIVNVILLIAVNKIVAKMNDGKGL